MITDKLTHLLHHFGDEKFTLCRKTRDSGEQPLQHGDAIALATVDAVWKPGEQKWLGGGGRCVSKSHELVKMAEKYVQELSYYRIDVDGFPVCWMN